MPTTSEAMAAHLMFYMNTSLLICNIVASNGSLILGNFAFGSGAGLLAFGFGFCFGSAPAAFAERWRIAC